MTVSRFDLLRGRFNQKSAMVRPPWSLEEEAFQQRCSRCDDCITLCPEKIVVRGGGGYPVIDFGRGECTFCGKCAEGCSDRALVYQADQPPWQIKATIQSACLALRGVVCQSCGEQCEPMAIRYKLVAGGVARPEIDLNRCTGCGACLKTCPVPDGITIG